MADEAAPGTERAKVRVEAIRTGLAAAAGIGAAAGLLLAFHRLAHQEYDTAEQRVTELYNAAAEQLGSDKAPVRLTALHTLERLANGNPGHQQTIVNIICAHLRMPYVPPPDSAGHQGAQEAHRGLAHGNSLRRRAARVILPSPAEPVEHDPYEERQVRLTAQRLLSTHLRLYEAQRWTRLSLDLTGAALIDFSLQACSVYAAHFTGATFHGASDFELMTISAAAHFDRTTFAGANFDTASFPLDTRFTGADFRGRATFRRAVFHDADFADAAFHAPADFSDTEFSSPSFEGAAFSRSANFRAATFLGAAYFNRTTFERDVDLQDAAVADVDAGHILPAGWHVEPPGGGGHEGKLVADPPPS